MSNVNDVTLKVLINVAGIEEYSMTMPAGKAAKMLDAFFDNDHESFTAEELHEIASSEHKYVKVGCSYNVFVSFPS